jgi:hypothetical protein
LGGGALLNRSGYRGTTVFILLVTLMRVEKDVVGSVTVTTVGLPSMLYFCTTSTNVLTHCGYSSWTAGPWESFEMSGTIYLLT